MTTFLHQRVPNMHLPPAFSATWPPCHAPSEAQPPFGHAPPASSSPAQAHNTQGEFTLQTFTLQPFTLQTFTLQPFMLQTFTLQPFILQTFTLQPFTIHLHSNLLNYRHLHYSLGLARAQARLLNSHLQSEPELNWTFNVLITVRVSHLSQGCPVQTQHPMLFVSWLSIGHANILPDAAGIQQTTTGYVQYFQLSLFICCFVALKMVLALKIHRFCIVPLNWHS